MHIENIWAGVLHLPLGATSIRPFVCERRRNLGPHSIWLFQCFVLNFSEDFGRINLKPIQIEYIWVEVVRLSLGAMSVCPFVCERCRNLGPPQHFTNPSDFFQCSILNLSCGFGRINMKPLQIEYIWGWSCAPPPWGRRRTVRFSTTF